MTLTNGYKVKDGKFYCHHLDLNIWSGPGNNRLDRPGVLNMETLTRTDFPGVRFRIGRRHSTHNIRPGGRGWTSIVAHTPEARPYSFADPHYGPYVDLEKGRFTDHRHLFFGTSPVLDGKLTNDPYPEQGNPHEFHLARMEHTGRTNCIKIGPKTWGNRSKIWVPDIQNWDGNWSSGHDFNPYWASIDAYNGPVTKIPKGLKVMLKAQYAERDGKKPEFVFRAEGMRDEGGYYKYLRVTLVFPRYYDSSQPVTDRFNPDWWRWSLPDGENGSGKWKFAFLPDVLGDFTLIEPVKISNLSTNWTTRTQQLLGALGVDDGGRGYHAEMLPDFSTKEDFPTLPDAQETFAHLGGLMKSDGTGMKWVKGAPVENQANDKESIAENIVIEVVDQAAFSKLALEQTPYPRPIMVTSPNNQPATEPPPTAPPPSLELIITPLEGPVGTSLEISAIALNYDFLNWTFILPLGQESYPESQEITWEIPMNQVGPYQIICEAVSTIARKEESKTAVCKLIPEPPDNSELEKRVAKLEVDVAQLQEAVVLLNNRLVQGGMTLADVEIVDES